MAQHTAAKGSNAFRDGPDYIQSLERGLAVIRAFSGAAKGMTLSEVAAAAGLSRAAVRRQLLTLVHLGYLRQDGRAFALTARVLELGYGYLGSLAYPELARAAMEALTQRVNESCSLGVLEGEEVIYVQRIAVRKVMTVNLGIGARLPAFCTSMGRVLLAGLPDAALGEWLAAARPARINEHTCIAPRELRKRILRARSDGFIYTEQELERGLCSIAVALHNPRGEVVAALNIGMPYRDNARERAIKEILPALRETAREIERIAGPRLPAQQAQARK